jgi:HAD domain in Swiss Army Knife RNA repair proteins
MDTNCSPPAGVCTVGVTCLPVRRAICLDVDGVLAPMRKVSHNPHIPVDIRFRTKSGWPDEWELLIPFYDMWFNAAMGAAIQALVDDTGADLYWCTSWLGETKALSEFASILGITPKTLEIPYSSPASRQKLTVAKTIARQYDRTVWFDDDGFSSVNRLKLIRPSPAIGLTQTHIDRAKEYFTSPAKVM